MALLISGTVCHIREVKLSRKPEELIAASRKATVPIIVQADGEVIEESMAIMRWSLARNDPEGWLEHEDSALIEANDGPFKHHLDRYKYPQRHASRPAEHRSAGLTMLQRLEMRLTTRKNLCGDRRGITDIAIFPFVRQFAETDRDWFDAQSLPGVQAWLSEHLQSPLFSAIMVRLDPWQRDDAPLHFPAS